MSTSSPSTWNDSNDRSSVTVRMMSAATQEVNGQQQTTGQALSEIPIHLAPIRPLEHLPDEAPQTKQSPDDQDHYRDRFKCHPLQT